MRILLIVLLFIFISPIKAEEIISSDEILIQTENKQASFPGGKEALKKWLRENTNYPEDAKRYGTILVTFTVKKNGKLDDFAVKKGVSEFLDYAAVQILKGMPKWEPALKNGKAVDAEAQVSVRFTPKNQE